MKTDGTQVGTVLVRQFDSVNYDDRPRRLTNVNGTLFFTARETRVLSYGKAMAPRRELSKLKTSTWVSTVLTL